MNRRNLLALALALVLVFTLFAGCAKTEAPASEPAPAAEPAPAEEPAETPAAAEEPAPAEEPAVPAGEESAPVGDGSPVPSAGEEPAPAETPAENPYQKVAYPLPLFEDQATLSMFYTLRGSNTGHFPNRDDLAFWITTQENLNVDLEFIEPGESVATEKYQLMCASSDMPDLVCENMLAMSGSAYNGGFDAAIADEVYIDLLDYAQEYAPNYAFYALGSDENRKIAVTNEGHLPAFFQVYSDDQLSNMGSVVNADMMDATGLELPDSVAAWMDVWQAMADNGVPYPVAASSTGSILSGSIASAVGGSIDAGFLVDAKTGDLVFGPTTDETRAYIELFRDLNGRGWMDPDWINVSDMDRTAFNNGLVPTRSMMINEVSVYFDQYGIPVEALPVIHSEGCADKQTVMGGMTQSRISPNGGIAVTTNCEQVENAMRFVDWFYSDEGADNANMGWEEGALYTIGDDGKRHVTDMYQQKDENDMEYKNTLTHDQDFALCYPNMRYDLATEEEKLIYDLWGTNNEENDAVLYESLPVGVSLTSEESDRVTSPLSDLDTYVETTVFSWLALNTELTDAAWNDFVSTCQAMDLATIQDTYTTAYQRYLAK